MNTILISFAIFFGAYLLNIFYISVFYHRALTHGAAKLSPRMTQWVANSGIWVTGIDPKAWVCMHRLHHQYSDLPQDPHSPKHYGVFGVLVGQVRSYERTIVGLIKNRSPYQEISGDLNFPVSWAIRKGLWWITYALHAILAVAVALIFQQPLFGLAYFVGIMSHPFQGWLVNSLAHRFGYRNHRLTDDSRNNLAVALLVFGEGYQNNHHARPESPKFSEKWFEVDLGYGLCRIAERMGILTLPKTKPLVVSPIDGDLVLELSAK